MAAAVTGTVNFISARWTNLENSAGAFGHIVCDITSMAANGLKSAGNGICAFAGKHRTASTVVFIAATVYVVYRAVMHIRHAHEERVARSAAALAEAKAQIAQDAVEDYRNEGKATKEAELVPIHEERLRAKDAAQEQKNQRVIAALTNVDAANNAARVEAALAIVRGA